MGNLLWPLIHFCCLYVLGSVTLKTTDAADVWIDSKVCKPMRKKPFISNLLLSEMSNSEHGVGVSGVHEPLNHNEPPPHTPYLHKHSLTVTLQHLSSNWMVISWYDSRWVRNTDWSMSGGWEGRLQAWHHAGVHSESPRLAERPRGLSTFLFPLSVCLSSVKTLQSLPGTPP